MSNVNIKTALFLVFSTGFAIFSMFFGSGNLVFPLTLGEQVSGYYGYATLGLFLTAVLIPFLGLFAILLFDGSYTKFFDRLDKYSAFLLPLLILALIGPFGVIPRTITVAYGSFAEVLPTEAVTWFGQEMMLDVPLVWFSAVACVVIFLFLLDRQRLISILGMILTPILLITLALIIGYGVIAEGSLPATSEQIRPGSALLTGFLQGYHTMDLMAAFFFAAVVIKHIEQRTEHHISKHVHHRYMILLAMLLGALLLAAIYAGFVYLGIVYADELNPEAKERSIAIIASLVLGQYAGLVTVVAVILACLTTAIALTIVSAEFLRERIMRGRMSRTLSIIIILVISYFISTLQFSGIFAILAPILQIIYPGLIVLTLCNLAYKLWGWQVVKTPVYATFIVSVALSMYF